MRANEALNTASANQNPIVPFKRTKTPIHLYDWPMVVTGKLDFMGH